MEDEKKLQETLIRRFIMTLVTVGVIEFILTTLSDRWLMPVIASVFFPEYEISESFSTLAVGMYIAGASAGSLISSLCSVLPAIIRRPITIFVSNAVSEKEASFFMSDEVYAISQMPFRQKLFFEGAILLLLLVLAIPYIAAAIRFTLVTMSEFRKIGAKRMQARKDYEKKRNLMISDIAHDLRTPITTISGYTQALADGLVKEEDVKTYLEAIRDKAVGMNDIIQLLFDFTRIDSEGFALTKEKTDICELVRECAAGIYSDAEAADMEMNVNIPDKKMELEVDRVHFKRVINNLMTNAVRHNHADNRIGVIVFEETGRINIAIADTGDIIDEEKAGHIFDPFFMGDESRNSKGGSGLGLSVAKKITEMHGFKLKLIQGSSVKRYKETNGYTKAFIIST